MEDEAAPPVLALAGEALLGVQMFQMRACELGAAERALEEGSLEGGAGGRPWTGAVERLRMR